MVKIHQKYGPIVRVAPDHVAICHPDGLNDLAGHRKPGQLENGKEVARTQGNPGTIIGANRQDHARIRKSMANAFSLQAMLDQQPLIVSYVDKLFENLERFAAKGEAFDAVAWYNYTTFDIVGDLAFGEPFGCLRESTYHPWVDLVFKSLKNIAFDSSFRRMGFLYNILVMLTPKSVMDKFIEHRDLSEQKVRKRLNTKTDRKDFMACMTSRKGKDVRDTREQAELMRLSKY